MKALGAVVIILVICLANPTLTKGASSSYLGGTYSVKKGDSMLYEEKQVYGPKSIESFNTGGNSYATYSIKGHVTLKVTVVDINEAQAFSNSFQTYTQVSIKENLQVSDQINYTSPVLGQDFTSSYYNYQDYFYGIFIIPVFNTTEQISSSIINSYSEYGYNFKLTNHYLTITHTVNNDVYTESYNWHTGWLEYKEKSTYNQFGLVNKFKTERMHYNLFSIQNIELLLELVTLSLMFLVLAITIYYYKNYRTYLQKTNSDISFWSYYKERVSLIKQKIFKGPQSQQQPHEIDKALETIEDILEENS